jgi:hypothetical protein
MILDGDLGAPERLGNLLVSLSNNELGNDQPLSRRETPIARDPFDLHGSRTPDFVGVLLGAAPRVGSVAK